MAKSFKVIFATLFDRTSVLRVTPTQDAQIKLLKNLHSQRQGVSSALAFIVGVCFSYQPNSARNITHQK